MKQDSTVDSFLIGLIIGTIFGLMLATIISYSIIG